MTDSEIEIMKFAFAAKVSKIVAVANERIDSKNQQIADLTKQLEVARQIHEQCGNKILAERDKCKLLKDALVGLVGSSDPKELNQMEAALRQMPMPDEDKSATINAIHALREEPKEE